MTDSFNFSVNMSGLSSVKLQNVAETCDELKENKIFNHLFENQKWLNKNGTSDEFLTGDEIKSFVGGKTGVRGALDANNDGKVSEDEFKAWQQSNIDAGSTVHGEFTYEDMKDFLGIVSDVAKGEREYKDSGDDLVTGKAFFSKYGAITGVSKYEYNEDDQLIKETVNMFDGTDNYTHKYFYDKNGDLDWSGKTYEGNKTGKYDVEYVYKNHYRYGDYVWKEKINNDFTNDMYEKVYEYNSSGRKIGTSYLDD